MAPLQKSPDFFKKKLKFGWIVLDTRQVAKISPLLHCFRHLPSDLGDGDMTWALGLMRGKRVALVLTRWLPIGYPPSWRKQSSSSIP